MKGRGADKNPPNRFLRQHTEPAADDPAAEASPPDKRPAPETRCVPVASRTIITRNDSPDISYGCSVNPYSGCEHGWTYFHILRGGEVN